MGGLVIFGEMDVVERRSPMENSDSSTHYSDSYCILFTMILSRPHQYPISSFINHAPLQRGSAVKFLDVGPAAGQIAVGRVDARVPHDVAAVLHCGRLAGDSPRHAQVIELPAGKLDVVLGAGEAGGQSEDDGSELHLEGGGICWKAV